MSEAPAVSRRGLHYDTHDWITSTSRARVHVRVLVLPHVPTVRARVGALHVVLTPVPLIALQVTGEPLELDTPRVPRDAPRTVLPAAPAGHRFTSGMSNTGQEHSGPPPGVKYQHPVPGACDSLVCAHRPHTAVRQIVGSNMVNWRGPSPVSSR